MGRVVGMGKQGKWCKKSGYMPEISICYISGSCVCCRVEASMLSVVWAGFWVRHMGMEDMKQPDGNCVTKLLFIYAIGLVPVWGWSHS